MVKEGKRKKKEARNGLEEGKVMEVEGRRKKKEEEGGKWRRGRKCHVRGGQWKGVGKERKEDETEEEKIEEGRRES